VSLTVFPLVIIQRNNLLLIGVVAASGNELPRILYCQLKIVYLNFTVDTHDIMYYYTSEQLYQTTIVQ